MTWLRLAGLIAGVVAIGFAAWWLFVRPQQARVAAASAKVEASGARATAGAAQDALKIVVDHQAEDQRIEIVTKEGERAVQTAEGAGESSPAVAAALRRAVCVSSAYRDDPACAALRGAGAVDGAAPADAGGAAPR